MKYTLFDPETGDTIRTVDIPDAEIARRRRSCNLSTKEAINQYLFDEGYIEDETVNELTAKAAANGVRNIASKGKRKAPTRKPDETKRALIAHLTAALSEFEGADLVEVTNIERIIAFTIGEDKYEVTLSKKRKPKA